MKYEKQLKPRFLITGETGGTGASTAAKKLSEKMDIPIISGGKYFRAIPNRFALFQQHHPDLTPKEQYQEFRKIYKEAYEKNGIDGITTLLGEGINQGVDGELLTNFHSLLADNQRETGKIDPFWDCIVDEKTMNDALQQPGFVWESKLAILLPSIDEMRMIVERHRNLALPTLKILLKLDPEIAAERVSQREQRPVSPSELITRKKHDFDRYGDLYRISGQPVAYDHLAAQADIEIDTSQYTPEAITREVLIAYMNMLATLAQEQQVLARPIMQQILALLEN